MNDLIIKSFQKLKNDKKKGIAILLDPDKTTLSHCEKIVSVCKKQYLPSYFFIGGSYISDNNNTSEIIHYLRVNTNIPVILFPGNANQLISNVDGILFLSLISGRNPEFLIGQHVIVAPSLKKMSIEVIPTGYILFESKNLTTANYISNTLPLPANKPELAVATALAGELLGLRVLFLDAGSGAESTIRNHIIHSVSTNVEIPVIVGGGITTTESMDNILLSGADIVVIGNHFEENIYDIPKFVERVKNYK